MAFGGRSGVHEPVPEETADQTFLDRVNAFGERHARVIIIVSTALIIVTVLIFAQVLWNRTLFDRVERDLESATTVESLEALRSRYAGSAAEPRVLATLGHRYAAEASLEKARGVYEDFLKKHSGHPLALGVNRSLRQVEENLKFLSERKAALLSAPLIDVHPVRTARVPGNPLVMGPIKEKHPIAVLKFKGKPEEIRLELFEDEAPNAVAAFVSLAEQKYFEGLSFAKPAGDERLRLLPKKENPSTAELAFERTSRPAEPGVLALARRGANNAAAEFEVLLKASGDPKEMTIFGRVYVEGGAAAVLQKLEEKDVVESIRIEYKRSHEYKPEYLK